MLQRLLHKHGYETSCAKNGEEAIERLRELTPTVVVLDYMMPGLSGLDVFHQMKRDDRLKDIGVLFYSASFDFDVARHALQMGAAEWLVKGVHTPQHFLDAVRRVYARER